MVTVVAAALFIPPKKICFFFFFLQLVEEVLKKLEIQNAVWCQDKEQHYYQIIFPRDAGDETENCLHALKEIGIGNRLNSIVSVSPCSVYESAVDDGFGNFYDE